MTDVLRRKIDRTRQARADGAPGADRGWRLALARAARDATGLELEVAALTVSRASLAEVLELAPDRALVALLAGPQDALGVLMLDGHVTAALIEMQTLGRLSVQAAPLRKPTRIDAAMVAGVIDRALLELDAALAEEADRAWAGGFRYASHLGDARPLGLMLEDEPYRVLAAEVGLGLPGRGGRVVLVLPAAGRGDRPTQVQEGAEASASQFAQALSARVQEVDCRLDAVIGRLTLPIRQVLALEPGEVLALPQAALDAVALETLDGRPVARARLGQNRGMRALKILVAEAAERSQPAGPPAAGPAQEAAGAPAAAPPGDWRAAG
jgi:flagellar motor switch protein FliM